RPRRATEGCGGASGDLVATRDRMARAPVDGAGLCDTIRDTMDKELAARIADLKRRRRSVAPHDMDKLLVQAGFTHRQGKGDHWVYTHPRRPFPLTIDPRNPLLPAYVSKAIAAIEEVMGDGN